MSEENIFIIKIIVSIILIGLFLIGIGEYLSYLSCKQKAEFYKDSWEYVYKLPAGCLMTPVMTPVKE